MDANCPSCQASVVVDPGFPLAKCGHCSYLFWVKKQSSEGLQQSVVPNNILVEEAEREAREECLKQVVFRQDTVVIKGTELLYVPFWLLEVTLEEEYQASKRRRKSLLQQFTLFSADTPTKGERSRNFRESVVEQLVMPAKSQYAFVGQNNMPLVLRRDLKEEEKKGATLLEADLPPQESVEREITRRKNQEREEVELMTKDLQSLRIDHNINNIELVYLPLWKVTVCWNNRDYDFLVEGSRGEVYGGENLPQQREQLAKLATIYLWGVAGVWIILGYLLGLSGVVLGAILGCLPSLPFYFITRKYHSGVMRIGGAGTGLRKSGFTLNLDQLFKVLRLIPK